MLNSIRLLTVVLSAGTLRLRPLFHRVGPNEVILSAKFSRFLRLLPPFFVLLGLFAPFSLVANPLNTGALSGARFDAAAELAQNGRNFLQLSPQRDDAAAIAAGGGFALVRASSARSAFEGTGAFNPPLPSLRTVAVLGAETVFLLAKPDKRTFEFLRDKAVVISEDALDPLRTLLGYAQLGLHDFALASPVDVAQAAAAGSIDAWFAVDLADSATAAALQKLGWQQVDLGPKLTQLLKDDGWPFALTSGPQPSLKIPTVLVAFDTTPKLRCKI